MGAPIIAQPIDSDHARTEAIANIANGLFCCAWCRVGDKIDKIVVVCVARFVAEIADCGMRGE
jgi:hypothetical protein